MAMLVGWLMCLVAVSQTSALNQQLNKVLEWKYADFAWKSKSHKASYVDSGKYDASKIILLDVDVWNGKVFVTSVNGGQNPGTLSTVSDKQGPGGNLLQPYPDWSWHQRSDCKRMTSVYRVAIDRCDRLWVLDTGKIGDDQRCPAQLLTFDLRTDKLLKKIKIPSEYSQNSKTNAGLLVTLAVETNGNNCDKTYVYIADVEGKALVVYNGSKFSRLEEPIYDSDPRYTTFTNEEGSFILEDGVLGLALQQPKKGEPKLWFRPLASTAMNNVETRELKKALLGERNITYQTVDDFLPSQAAAMAISSSGTLFYVLTKETAVGCYNVYRPFNKDNAAILVRDPEALQFGSGVKIVSPVNTESEEQVWFLTNRLLTFSNGTIDTNVVNFRIMMAKTGPLIDNTICTRPRS